MLLFIGRPWKTKTRTQSSEHGVIATGKYRDRSSGYGIERHVRFLYCPEAMEQYGQLASDSHNGFTLSLLATSGSQMKSPLPQRRVLTVRSQDMVRALDQQTPKISVTSMCNAELRIMIA